MAMPVWVVSSSTAQGRKVGRDEMRESISSWLIDDE